jgi:hypothetical protein
VIFADVVPDVLHVAVVYADAGSDVGLAVGLTVGLEVGAAVTAELPLPPQAANVTPKTAKSAQNAPVRDLFFRIGRASRY